MEEKNDYTDAVSDNRNGQEIEVGIAGAGDRILAALLNQLFTFLILLVPFVGLIAFAVKNEGRIGGREEIFGLLLGMTSLLGRTGGHFGVHRHPNLLYEQGRAVIG